MHTYVITASKHGSTRAIGAAIARRLRDRGHDAIALDADDAGQLDESSAIVLGSPIYMGEWLKPARKILDALEAEDPGRLVFTFTVGPIGDPPKPADAKPEEEVERFRAERAVSDRIFSGTLDRSKLGRLERLAVAAVKAPDGDYRDWAAIDAWADEISDALVAAQTSLVGAGAHGAP
jgi:menaquinone-dependent protoporphyrinogen oxidase